MNLYSFKTLETIIYALGDDIEDALKKAREKLSEPQYKGYQTHIGEILQISSDVIIR